MDRHRPVAKHDDETTHCDAALVLLGEPRG